MYEEFQSELTPGESVIWAGQPSRKVIFHKEDVYLIPFSLLWGGFAIFWEASVLGFMGGSSTDHSTRWFLLLWGVPFVLVGQYIIWGRFIYAAWKKGNIQYAVTNKRVLVLDVPRRRLTAAFLEQIPIMDKTLRLDGIGTLRFGNPPVRTGRSSGFAGWDALNSGDVPTFVDIEGADTVYRLVNEQREQKMKAS